MIIIKKNTNRNAKKMEKDGKIKLLLVSMLDCVMEMQIETKNQIDSKISIHLSQNQIHFFSATSFVCNCERNDYVWRFDEGHITDRSLLPLTAVYFYDTDGSNEKGYFTLGPLVCHPGI